MKKLETIGCIIGVELTMFLPAVLLGSQWVGETFLHCYNKISCTAPNIFGGWLVGSVIFWGIMYVVSLFIKKQPNSDDYRPGPGSMYPTMLAVFLALSVFNRNKPSQNPKKGPDSDGYDGSTLEDST